MHRSLVSKFDTHNRTARRRALMLVPEGWVVHRVFSGRTRNSLIWCEFVGGGYIVRYCEVLGTSIDGVELGRTFRAGQVVARVGKMFKDAMLHFEMYSGTMHGHLSQKDSASPFHRRLDLVDPTPFLDRLSRYVGVCHPPVAKVMSSNP